MRLVPRGLIYWLPTQGAVSDFASTKVDDFINENGDELGDLKALNNKYNVGLKYFYGIPTYWRGLESKTGVKSISADAAVYDEFDEADPAQVTQARQRLSASEVKLSRELSVPTIPDFGIDKRFQETDQCHYIFKCNSCATWNILEENWPNTFCQDKLGNYYPGCKKCKAKLDIKNGKWVQKYPNKSLRGYQISQLYSPFVSPNQIIADYQNTEFPGHFYNHVLGLPYLSAEDRLTYDQVLATCDPMRIAQPRVDYPCAMGVDVGSKLHVVCLETGSASKTKVHFIGEVTSFEELDTIALRYNVKQAVIDALPETRKSREFVDRKRFNNWMCYYSDNQKGSFSWNEVDRVVSANRTESLDAGTLAFTRGNISLPQRNPIIEEFAKHCSNIAKVAEENRETGAKRYIYKKLGPDHFRHALNYAMIAASRMRSGPVVSIMR
jgi:hypothetical protein